MTSYSSRPAPGVPRKVLAPFTAETRRGAADLGYWFIEMSHMTATCFYAANDSLLFGVIPSLE
jgi:hypothetical protein